MSDGRSVVSLGTQAVLAYEERRGGRAVASFHLTIASLHFCVRLCGDTKFRERALPCYCLNGQMKSRRGVFHRRPLCRGGRRVGRIAR